MFIYKTTCLVNGKIYIGQSVRNEHRIYFGSGSAIFLAVKKYGRENFTREILRRCKTTKELNFFERYFIKKFNSMDRSIGYNLTEGGDFSQMLRDLAKNPEHLRRMGEIIRKRMNDPEVKKRYSERFTGEGNPMYGKSRPVELIEKANKTFRQSYETNPQIRLNFIEGGFKAWETMRAVPGKVEEMISRRARSKQRPVEMWYKTPTGRAFHLRTFTGAVEVQREKGFCMMNIGTCARRNGEVGRLQYVRYGFYWKYPDGEETQDL